MFEFVEILSSSTSTFDIYWRNGKLLLRSLFEEEENEYLTLKV